MTKEEMTRRCEEAVMQYQNVVTGLAGGIFEGLIFDLTEWNRADHYNKDEIELSIGRCYAGLKMLEIYLHADETQINKGIEDVLKKA